MIVDKHYLENKDDCVIIVKNSDNNRKVLTF